MPDITSFRCPRYAELPKVELYMDQVLLVLEETLQTLPDYTSDSRKKRLTASMINNYVKQKLIAPPKSKRYTRCQLAELLLVSLLKNLLPIADIKLLLQMAAPNEAACQVFFDQFGAYLEQYLAQTPLAAQQPIEPPNLAQKSALALAHKIYLQNFLHQTRLADPAK